MDIRHERGMALILALFLMMAMSVLGASMMFLSQTETFASSNYRMMSQARYAAESGMQKAANFLLDTTQYQPPGTVATDSLASYDYTKSPVKYNNADVILSANPDVPSNYPVATVKAAFLAAATGTLNTIGAGQAGNIGITYKASAKLISMSTFDSYGGTTNVIQTWEITGDGSLVNNPKATVEVVAMVETPKVAANSYAAFATSDLCGSLLFNGNTQSDSYDSSKLNSSSPPPSSSGFDHYDGDVGTNGNLNMGGTSDVYGNFYTPRSGVGTCTNNATGATTALTENAKATVSGSMVQLPKSVVYPPPIIPAPSTAASADINGSSGACALLPITAPATCTTNGDDVILDAHGTTMSLPTLSIRGKANLVLVAGSNPPGTYDINSITVASQSNVSVKATSPSQGVLVNIVGKDATGAVIDPPVDMQGGSFAAIDTCSGCSTLCSACSPYDASMLQFVYGGTAEIKMAGNSGAAATVYAPNAKVTLVGTSDLYGSVLGKTIEIKGNMNIHYDRRLQHDFWVAGQPMASTFSWKRY